jgi:hypothetical protein
MKALTLCVVLVACASDPDKALFEKLGRDAEPHFAALRGPADTVLRTPGTGDMVDRTISKACLAQMPAIEALADLDFNNRSLHATTSHSVADVAHMIVSDKRLFCDESRSLAECSRWCVMAWAELAIAVERFRGDAARHGVKVRSLVYEGI